MILALAGGVGGAKLAHGLSKVLRPEELVIAVNTGDDFEHLGVRVSPDLDTVMYTLAGIANPETGWGQAAESWTFMAALERLGGPAWFRLGDKDLATNVERTRRLKAGETLGEATRALCERLGVTHRLIPMSDDPVPTIVHTDQGPLEFQDYFVRLRCAPRVARIEYRNAERSRPSPALLRTLERDDLAGVVLCPSNPYLSIGPMLALPGLRAAISRARRVVAVSPIIGGAAIKGPAAKIMRELGREPSALEVARYYENLVNVFLIDRADEEAAPAIGRLGMDVRVHDILMRDDADRVRLARVCAGLIS